MPGSTPRRLIELLHSRPGCHFSPTGTLTLEGVRGEESVERSRELLDFLAGDAAPGGASLEAS